VPELRPLGGPLAATPATVSSKGGSVQGAHWTDPRLWTPPVYDQLETLEAVHAPALRGDERQRLGLARELLQQALALVPDHPLALFDLGLVCHLLGDDAAARRHLAAATDFDRAPRRGADLVNGLIRSVAAEVGRVVFYDADAFFREHSPGGLLSYEVLTDVCHLQPGVRMVFMGQLVPSVLAAAAEREAGR
jgi:tetratricopeptide (TPR) repeat protein